MANCARVIALIDMDCFYVQVEERDDTSIKGKPAAVVQYNAWKGGGLIAVNYEARAKGVNRHMRGDDAKAACNEIILVKVPELRGKADLTKYRAAGAEVINVVCGFPTTVERASVDEAYIDLTEMVEKRLSAGDDWDVASSIRGIRPEYLGNNFVIGYETSDSWLESLRSEEIMPVMSDVKLAIGAEIVGQIRKAIFDETGFRCSAGIAHNKVLAKLVCGINKPNKQTVLPYSSVPELFAKTKVKQVRNLGGKMGDLLVERLNCETMADLGKFNERDLCHAFGIKTGSWLYNLARGNDDEAVTARQLSKSIGCNKNFTGPEALKKIDKIKHWIEQLSAEVVERLEKDFEMNNRKSKSLTLNVRFEDGSQISKSCGIPSYNTQRMTNDVSLIIEKIHQKDPLLAVTSLGLSASKFEDELDASSFLKIDSFFQRVPQLMSKPKPSCTITRPDDLEITPNLPDVSPSGTLPDSLHPFDPPTHLVQSSDFELPVVEQPPELPVAKSFITQAFFEHLAEAEISVSKSLSEIRDGASSHPTGGQESSAGLFNRNSTALKLDLEIFGLGGGRTREIVIENINPSTSSDVSNDPGSDAPAGSSPVKSFTQKCERCGQSIAIWDLPMHSDYHFAKDLQREFNGLPPLAEKTSQVKSFQPVTLPKRIRPAVSKRKGDKSPVKSGAKSKRGRPGSIRSAVVMRPIDSYFTPVTLPQTPAQDGR